jgi:hypothetical protein
MGFLAGYAVSLFGRQQDRLSHVLVQLPFQNIAEFHFPPKVPREFASAAGNIHSSADCSVVLGDIPFVCKPPQPLYIAYRGTSGIAIGGDCVTSGSPGSPSRRIRRPTAGTRLGSTSPAQGGGGQRRKPRMQRGEDGFAGGGHVVSL